jgi:hypothetical protein
VTIAFGLAWVMAPIKAGTERATWQTLSVVVLVLLSLSQIIPLYLRGRTGWRSVNEAWKEVLDAEPEGAEGQSHERR